MLAVGFLFRSSEWYSARHVLSARTDRDVHVSDLVADLSDCVSLAQRSLVPFKQVIRIACTQWF